MMLAKRAFLLVGVVAALCFHAAEAGSPEETTRKEDAPQEEISAAYPTELKLYLPKASLVLPKGRDAMEPSKVTTAEDNIKVLRTVLSDSELSDSLAREAQKTCAAVKAFACGDAFKALDCKNIELQSLRKMLSSVDMQVGSPQGAHPDCNKAMKKGLVLFDIMAVATPFLAFQIDKTQGELAAVSALFSSLNIRASIPRSEGKAAKLKGESESPESTQDVSASLLEMMALKRGKGKAPKELVPEMLPVAGAISKALVTYPEAYLAFAGTGGPLASLIINWFYQVMARSEEFFGPSHSSRRPLASLGVLLTEGHESRMTQLYQMCGISLGSRRIASKLPPNNLFVPREFFARNMRLAGLPRLSCDLMTQALLAMHLGMSKDCVAPTQKAQSSSNLFENLSCSLKDTLLPGLEAKAEGETSQATETSFAETSPAEAGASPKESKNMSGENAKLSFHLMALRAGRRKAAAKLLNADAGSSFDACKKALKGLGGNEADISEDSLQCSTSWEKKIWEKKLRCPKKLLNMQCAAARGLYQIYEDGVRGSTEDYLHFLAKEEACGGGEAACSKKLMLKQSPFKVIATDAALFNKGLQAVPAAENMLRIFTLLSGNAWKSGKDILSGKALLSKLPADFYMQLRSCIDVVVHPLAFIQLNQLSFTRSETGGARSAAGGLSQKLDSMLAEAATKGMPQKLKQKLQSGANLTAKDYRGINFAHVKVPQVNTWQDYVKAEVLDNLVQWMLYPDNEERLHYECSGGAPSNIFAIVKDSMELLSSAEAEGLTLIGKVVSPKETSLGKTGFFKGILKKMLRLPPYKAQHQSFVAVKIDVPEALKAVRTLTSIYMQHKDEFENQLVFVQAVLDLFAHYEKKYTSPSRELLGVPENTLVPKLHPNYASLPQQDRLREMKESAMSDFFRHTWTLIFSVSANNMLNAAHMDKLEKTFTQDAWKKSINDPFQASSFGLILMGGDIGLQLFNQLLPANQRKMLMRAKTLDGVTEMANTGNETGQASMGGSCPPMGLCLGDNGNVFIPDPTGSPPLTALQVVLKTGVMASIAVFAGPVLAVYNIAVSNFEILSRLEMALGNAVQRIVQKLLKSKVIKNIKKMFKRKEDFAEGKTDAKMSASTKQAALGDEVDAKVSALVQIQQRRVCKLC
ncbi:hypothetical protein Emed_001426 [Eimeria media]